MEGTLYYTLPLFDVSISKYVYFWIVSISVTQGLHTEREEQHEVESAIVGSLQWRQVKSHKELWDFTESPYLRDDLRVFNDPIHLQWLDNRPRMSTEEGNIKKENVIWI